MSDGKEQGYCIHKQFEDGHDQELFLGELCSLSRAR